MMSYIVVLADQVLELALDILKISLVMIDYRIGYKLKLTRILLAGSSNSTNGTRASLSNFRKPTSLGRRNIRLRL